MNTALRWLAPGGGTVYNGPAARLLTGSTGVVALAAAWTRPI